MIFYHGVGFIELPVFREVGVKDVLLSYHYQPSKKLFKESVEHHDSKVEDFNFFIDSGAYSAASKGATIDIDKYIEWLHLNKQDIVVYVNLDVINDTSDAKASRQNLKYMEDNGLSPMPVYHSGEDTDVLKRYCTDYEYVGLGGMVGTKVNTQSFIDDVFKVVGEHKFHLFGVGSWRLLVRFKPYSCDSARVVREAVKGVIITPYGDMSISSTSTRSGAKNHFHSLLAEEKEFVKSFVKQLGFSLGALATDPKKRIQYNAKAIEEIIRQKMSTDEVVSWEDDQPLTLFDFME